MTFDLNFRISEIILIGFGSFRERQSFRMPKEPGLYFMRGENRQEPRLGSNGAGKSTIWKALCWVLWGKTANGLKAGEISSWGIKKGAEVILCFEGTIDGKSNWYFLKRTWKPNSWTLANLFDATPVDLTKDETNPVLSMLKLQYEPFLHSIYLAQREAMFLDLKPEPKAQLFSSVMDLDKWLGYSTKASQAASDQDKISRSLESQRAELKGRLEESGTSDLQVSADEWEADDLKKLRDIEEAYDLVLKKSKAAKLRLQDAQEAQERSRVHSQDLLELRNVAYDANEKAYKALRKEEDNLLVLKHDLEHKRKHTDQLDAKGCPTCGRNFNPKENHELIIRAEDDERAAEALFNLADDRVYELRKAFDRAEDKLESADQVSRAALRDLEDAVQAVAAARKNHELEERRLDQLEEEAERLMNTPNPFATLLEDKQASLAQLRGDFEAVNARLDVSYASYALYSFWVRGFKEVRLQLIAEALDQLEVEVNSELTELGLVGWELRFDVDAETKKGTLLRGFSVSVLSPHSEEGVPWESWSGGESQRLRLAAQCGLSNLIRDRTGCDLPLEVWDEPTEGLSEEGITDLMTALSERAQREHRIIWVVDHRALGYGGFTDTATIIKDEKGSRVVQGTV